MSFFHETCRTHIEHQDVLTNFLFELFWHAKKNRGQEHISICSYVLKWISVSRREKKLPFKSSVSTELDWLIAYFRAANWWEQGGNWDNWWKAFGLCVITGGTSIGMNTSNSLTVDTRRSVLRTVLMKRSTGKKKRSSRKRGIRSSK